MNIAITYFIFDYDKYRARFKDIYPDQHLSLFYYMFIAFFPLAFIALTVFLCLKNEDQREFPKRLFKIRYVSIALIPLLGVQVVSTKLSYLSASPSTYYAVDIGHDMKEIFKFKETIAFRPDLFEEYQKQFPGKMSSTQIVVLLAVNASVIYKDKDRSIASGTNEYDASIKSAFEIVEASFKYLKQSENTRLDFFDFSPLQWLHPSGPIEIFLLTLVEQQIHSKFNYVILTKSWSMLNEIEKRVKKINSSEKEDYSKKISKLRGMFIESRTFQSNLRGTFADIGGSK